ncbi:MAG TPA: hypothetical protein VFH06_01125 [Candidatus Saccharimonadales bacterium]|nr:hypothetical protein [Candidatus Saccharimonadales bacterium]
MKKIKLAIVTVFMALSAIVLMPSLTYADPASEIQGGVNAVGGNGGTSLEDNLKTVVNILLFILGAIAVIMIVIGGIRYATSNGDTSAVKGAKDTILYSVIGLIVAILAYAIVNFVVTSFK